MRMTIDPERAAPMLRQEAVEMVNGADANVTLDFSGLRRIDSGAVTALEELAGPEPDHPHHAAGRQHGYP